MPQRPALTHDRIVDAAVRVADRGGVVGVSMRNVGKELGVEAMSLYHHIANKDALLEHGVLYLRLGDTRSRVSKNLVALARSSRDVSGLKLKFKQGRAAQLDTSDAWEWADPLAAFVALYPEQCRMQACGIEVVREGRARGATLVNGRAQNLLALSELDPLAFHGRLAQTLTGA